MEAIKTLLSDISQCERQLHDLVTQREAMGINDKTFATQEAELKEHIAAKKLEVRKHMESVPQAPKKPALIVPRVVLDILPEIAEMEDKLCACLPVANVHPIKDQPIAVIEGPVDSNIQLVGDPPIISARVVSTYPLEAGTETRLGDPICDRYHVRLHTNGCIMTLADGCNWGPLPYQAAADGVKAFVDFLSSNMEHISSIRAAGPFLLSAITKAHNHIVAQHGQNGKTVGTTTLIGGLLLPVALSPPLRTSQGSLSPWGFVCVSLGDCKAFHYSPKTRVFTDITKGNRRNLSDARDPGGRLGPTCDSGAPDLRNLHLYYFPCELGDTIFLMSDGIHDNLDPQQLGILPSEVDLPGQSWEEAEKLDPIAVENYKDVFRSKWLHDSFNKDPYQEVTPVNLTELLMEHALATTLNCRLYMEKNPTKNQPKDYKAYPGKMDHSTVICCRVGPQKAPPPQNP